MAIPQLLYKSGMCLPEYPEIVFATADEAYVFARLAPHKYRVLTLASLIEISKEIAAHNYITPKDQPDIGA